MFILQLFFGLLYPLIFIEPETSYIDANKLISSLLKEEHLVECGVDALHVPVNCLALQKLIQL